MAKDDLLKNLSKTLQGLDKQELEILAEAVGGEVEARRPQMHLEDIRPGMSAENQTAAEAEIQRLLRTL